MSIRPNPTPLTSEEVLGYIKRYQESRDAQAQAILVNHYRDLVETLA
jgi:RNA polymerase sigma-B factor